MKARQSCTTEVFEKGRCREMTLKMCKYWIELDDDSGFMFEYCKAKKMKVGCCGVKEQCWYPNRFEEKEANTTGRR